MELTFSENKIPEKARLNRFLRIPIICIALIRVFLGANPYDVNGAIENYQFDIDKSNKWQVLKLKMKMSFYRYAYEFRFNEFASYGFEHKNRKECLEYVAAYEYLRIRNEIITKPDYIEYFTDKRTTYEHFKPFFKRDVVFIDNPDDFDLFKNFADSHDVFVFKIAKSNNGNGVKIIDSKNENILNLFNKAISEGGAILEELINQPGIMHDVHPSSVNTVRYVTYYDNEKLTKISTVFRFGRGSARIDNASQGGLYAYINPVTGIIETDGMVEYKSDKFKYHPDSNITIKGIQMPAWDELQEMIAEIVKYCPGKKLVGWDFAYSDKGWVLIEGNSFPGINVYQSARGKGLRKMYSQTYFKESKYWKKYSNAIY